VSLHPAAARTIALYLEVAGHGADKAVPVLQPVSSTGRAITPGGVYQMLAKYAATAGIKVNGGARTSCAPSPRPTPLNTMQIQPGSVKIAVVDQFRVGANNRRVWMSRKTELMLFLSFKR